MAVHVARQCQHIDIESGEKLPGHRGELGKDVEMGVAEMQEAIAIEGRGQFRNGDFHLDTTNVEGVAPSAPVQTEESQAKPAKREDLAGDGLAPSSARSVGAYPVAAALDRAPT